MSRPRLHDEGFLAFLRQKPCFICGRHGETEAAHIRIGFYGMGKKPDDRFATPLCADHHREQHSFGNESGWWARKGYDPFEIAAVLYQEYDGAGGTPRKKRKKKWPSRKFAPTAINRLSGTRTIAKNNGITEAEVLAIRADDRTQDQIAKDYQIAQTTVSAIKRGINWRHI